MGGVEVNDDAAIVEGALKKGPEDRSLWEGGHTPLQAVFAMLSSNRIRREHFCVSGGIEISR